MESLDINDIKSIFLILKSTMVEKQDFLTGLDSVMGDGDLGITMTKAFTAAREEAERSDEVVPGKLLMRLGMTISKAAPSTMGTLVATGFMKGGKALEEKMVIQLGELAAFFTIFVKSIMERGKSVPGNKTFIDTLYPAAQALASAEQDHRSLAEGIQDAYRAALTGLEDSKQMKAQHGRAAYYQDASIGRQDGGATVGVYIIEGFHRYITQL
jgi:dihydroxyacetone kinase-like protein